MRTFVGICCSWETLQDSSLCCFPFGDEVVYLVWLIVIVACVFCVLICEQFQYRQLWQQHRQSDLAQAIAIVLVVCLIACCNHILQLSLVAALVALGVWRVQS